MRAMQETPARRMEQVQNRTRRNVMRGMSTSRRISRT